MQPQPKLQVAALPGVRTRPRAAAAQPGRRHTWRFLKAYWVTFVVIASYLSVKLQMRFRSAEAIERILADKHRVNARRIERAILSLQGLFIKVGQLISIMTNFLPREFRAELEGLQDQVPPRSYADIEQRIREEFGGRGPRDLFAEFAESPIAAASIGQVHVARLRSGEKVAVKVQYPDIDELVQKDLRTLRRIFGIVGFFVKVQGLDAVHREIAAMVQQELDFLTEAQNSKRIAKNFADRPDVAFPRVEDSLTTSRVLTTHWEDGVKVADGARLDEEKLDRREVARMVVEAYCQQIFVDGIYHADPHPGNVLARTGEDGKPCVVFLDFGAVAEVSAPMREGMIEFLQGALHRDNARILKAMRLMGFVARGADDRILDKVIEHFHQRFQEEIQIDSFNLRDVKLDPDRMFENIADLRRMDISLRDLSASFHVPKEWLLLERTVLSLMGLCTALDPEMNPMSVIRPYLERFVLGEADWSKFVVGTTKELVLSAVALPGEMRRFLTSAARGEVEFGGRNIDDAAKLMYSLGHQGIYAAVGIAAAVIAVVLEGQERDARPAWYTALGAGVVLLWSFWLTRSWLRKRKRR